MKKNKSISLGVFLFLAVLYSCKESTQKANASKKAEKLHAASLLNNKNLEVNKLDKNIRCIFQDSKGNYWFGSNGAGLYHYNGKTLRQFTVNEGLADNQVLSIQEDELGNIWFGTGVFGISKFDGSQITTLNKNQILSNGSAAAWKLKSTDLWFYAGGGVFRYSNQAAYYLPFAPANIGSEASSPFSLSRYGVYSILKDKKGNLWFGTQAEGVAKYDGEKLSWFKDKGLAGPAVLALFEDSRGNIWFGNNGAGLFMYDGETLKNITAEKGLGNADFRASGKAGPGTLARVYAINEDNEANIWIGTIDAGLWKYNGGKLTNFTTKDGLTSNAVNTIYKDKKGELWFGTDDNGICKFNGFTFEAFTVKE